MENKTYIRQEKFLRLKKTLRLSTRYLLFGFGTFGFFISWGAMTYHNYMPIWAEILITCFLFFFGVIGVIFVVNLLMYCLRWLEWRRELPVLPVGNRWSRFILYFLLAYAAAGGIFVGIVFGFHLNAQKCDDAGCFIAAADNCDAVYWETTDGYNMRWSFYASGCKLEKKLLSVDPSESAKMKAVLTGQSLTCVYAKNDFNLDWTSSMTAGLEGCQGDLKETIGQLFLFL